MDQILYWNDVALEANKVAHTTLLDKNALGPVLSARALAITHLAMYDAFVGTSVTALPHYMATLTPAAAGASVNAAIAAAAHCTLTKLYPNQKPYFDLKHAQSGINETGMDDGHEYGLLVGQAVLNDRASDPDTADDGYDSYITKGKHRPDPDNDQGYYAPFYGAKSKCFAVTKRWALDAPYALSSPEYNKAVKQVRAKGIAAELMGTLPPGSNARTAEETLKGIFWGYDGAYGLGTPPRLYNQILRTLAAAKANSTEQNAQLFAMANVAMADAGILAWEQKYRYNFWRPVVAIREHDKSMGPTATGSHNLDNDCDPGWLPLGAPKTNSFGVKNFTPNFPAYPSGHATFGAAALHTARLFYGVAAGDRANDNLFKDAALNSLTVISDEFNGVNKDDKNTIRPKHTRTFPGGLWQMIIENGFSRVLLGVHWYFDAFAVKANDHPDFSKNIGGAALGINIAEDIFAVKMAKSTVPPAI